MIVTKDERIETRNDLNETLIEMGEWDARRRKSNRWRAERFAKQKETAHSGVAQLVEQGPQGS